MVNAFVVFAVTVADPPREIADPFTVIELLVNPESVSYTHLTLPTNREV